MCEGEVDRCEEGERTSAMMEVDRFEGELRKV